MYRIAESFYCTPETNITHCLLTVLQLKINKKQRDYVTSLVVKGVK